MKVKLEPFYCVVRSGGFMQRKSCRVLKKLSIEEFMLNYKGSDSWAKLRKQGYKCIKFKPVLAEK